MEDYINESHQNFPAALKALLEDFNNRLINVEIKLAQLTATMNPCHGSSMLNMNPEYPVEWKFKCPKDFTDYIETRFYQIKHDPEWRKNFQCIEFSGLSAESKEKIIAILTKEKANVSRLVNAVAKEIIGRDKLTMYSLGTHGMPTVVGASKLLTRPPLAEEDENKLRQVLGFIDKLFVSREGWEILVRKPINQMGREFKRNRRSDSFIVPNIECEPTIRTLPSSTPVMAISNSSEQTTTKSTINTDRSSSVQKKGENVSQATLPTSIYSMNYDFLSSFGKRGSTPVSSKERDVNTNQNAKSQDKSSNSYHDHDNTTSRSENIRQWC